MGLFFNTRVNQEKKTGKVQMKIPRIINKIIEYRFEMIVAVCFLCDILTKK